MGPIMILGGLPLWTDKNRAKYNRDHLRYPSDLTEDEWAHVEPLIPPARRGGGKRRTDMRAVMNGVMYILSTGCQWRYIPKDFPPRSTLHDYFTWWLCDGTLDRIHYALYVECRENAEREASPTACIIDSQSVKSAEKGGPALILTPIFNSANYQVTERQRQSTPRRRRGTTFSIGRSQEAAASRTVGGSATPAARKARLAAGRGAERTIKRLPSCSISVSVSESRSAMICGQEPERASAAMRSSSAFFSTSARKLQNTWPRMVASSLWKIGRVESRCLAVRKVCSTVHNCL